jgi:putative transposase
MKLIVNIKLKPLEMQSDALIETLKEANKACDWISKEAFANKVFKQFNLHKIVYHAVKDTFNLSAQIVVRAISKVADSYKIQTVRQTTFKPTGSVAYDDRIISFKKTDIVSIWTTQGRLNIPFVMGEYQRKFFQFRQGEVDLIYRNGQFFLNCVCDVPEDSPLTPDDILGIDFGITNLVTSSDGETFSGADVERIRQKRFIQRQILQHKASEQTKGGKRPRSIHTLLKRLSGREKRFRQIENHRLSKTIVSLAKDTNRGIALENLKGIRTRIEKRFRKVQRAKVSGWSFYQLKEMIAYKSKLRGVPVFFVDPKYTSQTCSACGHCEKASRKSQSEFECVKCNHSLNADFNAALNIRGKAIVTVTQKSENIVLSNAMQVQV